MNHRLLAWLKAGMAVVLLTGLCGCWSAEELNNRAFVNMMIVDLADNGQTELTLGFFLPNRMIPGSAGGGGGETTGSPYTFVSKTDSSIAEALERIQADLSRSVTFGQTRIVVLGREYAQKGVDPVLEFISRQPAFHLSSNIFVTQDKGTEIVKTPTVFERFISDILRKYVGKSFTLDTTAKDMLMARYKGGDILLPLLKFNPKAGVGAAKPEKGEWLSSGGAAIMSGGKMSDIQLNDDELRGALWISSQLKSSIISVSSPTDGKQIDALAQGIKTKILPVVKGGAISFKIKTSADAYLLSSLSELDLTREEILLRLQEAYAKTIKERLNQVISKTRQAKSDAFIMSQYLDWRYPTAWRRIKGEWKSYYADQLPIEVEADVTVKRTGAELHSITQEKDL
ncbi:Ger(x)C family spore germination protein [Paenibacillus sp. M1]|uniref:Ger(X)C family spore germination protein n=1 Tax=Paenibacillus haidiansis TaxID=1574488 RepID=A0ABU7VKF4_9BACL